MSKIRKVTCRLQSLVIFVTKDDSHENLISALSSEAPDVGLGP